MTSEKHRPALQTVLKLDAATCLLMGVLLILASGPIAGLTAIPAPVLFWAGIILLPVGGFMASVSLAAYVPHWATLIVVAGNVLWALASLLLPAAAIITPNGLGWAFLSAQAAVVAVFAWLEWESARQSTALSRDVNSRKELPHALRRGRPSAERRDGP